MNRFYLLLILLTASCRADYSTTIVGTWQVDSVASFYNGFTYRSSARHWNEFHQYDTTHVVIQRTDGSQRLPYLIDQDTLRFLDAQRTPVSQFTIIGLTDSLMILRKEHSPLWPGPQQQRYEVRYFSRSTSPPVTMSVSPGNVSTRTSVATSGTR